MPIRGTTASRDVVPVLFPLACKSRRPDELVQVHVRPGHPIALEDGFAPFHFVGQDAGNRRPDDRVTIPAPGTVQASEPRRAKASSRLSKPWLARRAATRCQPSPLPKQPRQLLALGQADGHGELLAEGSLI